MFWYGAVSKRATIIVLVPPRTECRDLNGIVQCHLYIGLVNRYLQNYPTMQYAYSVCVYMCVCVLACASDNARTDIWFAPG